MTNGKMASCHPSAAEINHKERKMRHIIAGNATARTHRRLSVRVLFRNCERGAETEYLDEP